MNKKLFEDYFTFSKKERTGVLVLVLLILAIFIIPYYLPSSSGKVDKALLASIDSSLSNESVPDESSEEMKTRYDSDKHFVERDNDKQGRLFFFDPNILSEQGWIELGVKDRTAKTIAKFIAKGGSFRKPEDLRKIFGLSPTLVERLMPYVRITPKEKKQFVADRSSADFVFKKKSERKPVDINLADSLSLLDLKGIGPKLAGRILKFRDRLGGFHSPRQLKEVYGLPDSTLEVILPELNFNEEGIRKIKINEADVAVLRQHPYIGWNLARLIVRYRDEHGLYNSIEDLLKIDIITAELIARLSPYVDFGR